MLAKCVICGGEGVLEMSKCDVITLVCEALSKGQIDESKEIIKGKYPFDMVETKQRNYSKTKLLQIFVRDGFIDRYSGEKLVFPGALRVLSELMPKEFPYQEHWKMSECHIAWWQFFPTVDHKVPIARGGKNDNENLVCTSMLRNSAKGNFTLEELNWELLPSGNYSEWDGMTDWFIQYVDENRDLLKCGYSEEWYKAVKKIMK